MLQCVEVAFLQYATVAWLLLATTVISDVNTIFISYWNNQLLYFSKCLNPTWMHIPGLKRKFVVSVFLCDYMYLFMFM